MFLAPEIIFGCAPPKFWTALIKLGLVLTIVQNFKPVSPRISEISCSEKKLEIWGKAQRESAQRPKSDWGKLEGGEISLASKSRGPNSNALLYAECALST